MYRTVTFSAFCDAFFDKGRQDSFSYKAKRCLFDYLGDYEDSTGTHVELDVIALCCDYNEASWDEIADNYSIALSDCEDDDERIEAVRDYLEYHSFIVGEPSDGVFVYQVF